MSIRQLIRYLADRGIRTGMARGFLIIDENVDSLAPSLKEANFHVRVPKKTMSDDEIKEDLLGNRVLVTKNTKDFIDDAPVYDYGIIALEGLKFIDPSPTYKTNTTARIISQAYRDFELHAERSGFVLYLKEDGKHVFKRLG